MEILVLILLGAVAALLVMPVVALVKTSSAKRQCDELSRRLGVVERELAKSRFAAGAKPGSKPETIPSPAPVATPIREAAPAPPAAPPPIPIREAAKPPEQAVQAAAPIRPPAIEPAPAPAINWEQFMGAKLFAWIGGLALFLGLAFFVKYSFERNLIPPEVRVAIGFLAGLGLVVGGVMTKRKENVVTAQTLCATGVLVLYAVTFACRSYYHFPFFGPMPTFLLMTLITAAAFLLAVRMDALVVAILGMAGGFLTPILLSTGEDNPFGLFGYIALLDIGLLAVAHRQRWKALPILGAAGTVLMQIGWMARFFVAEKYFAGNKVLVAMVVFAGFQALFVAVLAWAKRLQQTTSQLAAAALGVSVAAVFAGFYFLFFPPLGERPLLLFTYVMLIDLGVIVLALIETKLAPAQAASGVAAFLLLAMWTAHYLTDPLLETALGFYFVFALLHSVLPLVLQRWRGTRLPWSCHAFPALALLVVLMPIFKLTEASILMWPLVLFIDVVAIVIATITATLLPIVAVLILTLLAIGGWLLRIPTSLEGLPTSLFLLGGFAVLFLIAAMWACRRLAGGSGRALQPRLFGGITDPANLSVQIPALSATLPFLLLIMVTLRLPLANPTPVFGLALVLVALLLGMAKILSLEALPAVGMVSAFALESAWHFRRFDPAHAATPLLWYLVFYAVFSVFPFVFHRQYAAKSLPWATAAMSGPLHFLLVYQIYRATHTGGMPGLIPAAFTVPSLIGLFALIKRTPAASRARNAQLAVWGGVALFFITLIFPIQVDREWITVGWALEGVALCWLFHRVPHSGLRLTGVGLLVVAFARLALNPAVLTYHPRAAVPIFNWYLYAYGIVTVCLFLGARLLAPPRNLVLGWNIVPLLYGLCAVIGFLLVNIEIADYFSTPGMQTLMFQFTGNLARGMSYSIAWALFALMLLVIGIRTRVAPVRYASLGLLGVTVLKLFLFDLSQLDQLYRIAAFIVVAIIAILASFLYQRFLGTAENNHENPPAPRPAP